ncbi:hypothetical protein RFI_25511, partial [Reticulomyxa filosa]
EKKKKEKEKKRKEEKKRKKKDKKKEEKKRKKKIKKKKKKSGNNNSKDWIQRLPRWICFEKKVLWNLVGIAFTRVEPKNQRALIKSGTKLLWNMHKLLDAIIDAMRLVEHIQTDSIRARVRKFKFRRERETCLVKAVFFFVVLSQHLKKRGFFGIRLQSAQVDKIFEF